MLYSIVSWNVNGLRAIWNKGLSAYLEREQPDILCIQETKAQPEQLESAIAHPDGYRAEFHSCTVRKGYSGVATYARYKPLQTYCRLGRAEFDNEGRILISDFDDFVLVNAYFPNGSLQEKGRLQYKLDFYDALFFHTQQLRARGRKVVVCGDYNTAHTELDLARPKENQTTSGFLPIERAKLDALVAMGYVDTFREFERSGGHYSWWSYRQRSRERNIGWRLDYFFVSRDLLPYLQSSSLQPEVQGSDHCPVKLVLRLY
ncbi:MAG: exodeoxyribonuclease III [Bacteroidota bacterium]|nr:exodeoxyribonuclease III [Candidatus Kapabacteria bacterium]MDW8220383.1 exodeoxyribonuclease III [Bacteroidota bacterium]